MTNSSSPQVTVRMLAAFGVYVLVFAFLPLLLSGHWQDWRGWAYALVSIISAVGSRLLVARRNPDLLAERGRAGNVPEAKAWDKILSPLVGLGSFFILLVCGLDMRWGWPPALAAGWSVAGLAAYLAGSAFGGWALVENRFFSGMVRIQTERGHRVVDSGPYRLVRHPGYAGALLAFAAMPLLLDALWGFLPALLLGAALVYRTALEDKTLQAELPGYADYARRTRYRLLPGIW